MGWSLKDKKQRDEIMSQCTICSHKGLSHEQVNSELYTNYIYPPGNLSRILIRLCVNHDIEFFLTGQERFMRNHSGIVYDVVDTYHPEFIKAMIASLRKDLSK